MRNAPTFIAPQLLETTARPPDGPQWLHEIKYDGYRVQIHVAQGRTTVFTRNGFDWTWKFRRLEAEAGELPDCVIDGELCALDENGHPDFSELTSAIRLLNTDRLVVFAFDILFEGREDLRPFPLSLRKSRLKAVLDAGGEHIGDTFRYVDEQPGPSSGLLKAACALELEGIVSKRRDERYRSGRSSHWQKAKCRPSSDVVAGGYDPGPPFALACGLPESDGRLRYVGRVRNGISGRAGAALLAALKSRPASSSPFTANPAAPKGLVWVKPDLVVAIAQEEFTAQGKMRHPVYKGLREDLSAADCVPAKQALRSMKGADET